MPALNALLTLTENFSAGNNITLHPERCLNARFRAANCSRCANDCPAEGAITLTGSKPALDNNACLRCGLCLHRCPTEAFIQSDGLSDKLIKTAAALPDRAVDLVCPRLPHPEYGTAPQAVQIKRCLAALSPATLLELSSIREKEIRLDDTGCDACPLGLVHPIIRQTVSRANGWAALLQKGGSILLRTETEETTPIIQRPVYDVNNPPLSRRGLFSLFKPSGREIAAAEKSVEIIKSGKSVPVSARLPHAIPSQRLKILAVLKKFSSSQSANSFYSLTDDQILNLYGDGDCCTACGLCAKFCPTGALKFLSDNESFALTFQPSLCLGADCNICLRACPEQALSVQPKTATDPNIFTEKLLVAGQLTPCRRCKQPIAEGTHLPKTCFACRPKTTPFDF